MRVRYKVKEGGKFEYGGGNYRTSAPKQILPKDGNYRTSAPKVLRFSSWRSLCGQLPQK
jgi:hypothetical protein